jgi:hypothetical protein
LLFITDQKDWNTLQSQLNGSDFGWCK